jgi:Orsellinic acid/F9775 biosynthesis cluster protein D
VGHDFCFYASLRIFICIGCGVAVKPARLQIHRQKFHNDLHPISQQEIRAWIQKYNPRLEDTIHPTEVPFEVVPGIAWYKGFVCPAAECDHCTTSLATIQRHTRREHPSVNLKPSEHNVQPLFDSCDRRYKVTTAKASPLQAENDRSGVVDRLLLQYAESTTSDLLSTPAHSSQLTVFLTRYLWIHQLEDKSPLDIADWVSSPETPILRNIIKTYFAKVTANMLNPERSTILRWINSTKECVVFIYGSKLRC